MIGNRRYNCQRGQLGFREGNAMGELFLHIGMPKTGSTALQSFFKHNRSRLLEHGVNYPAFTEQPQPSWSTNGVFIHRYCLAVARGENPNALVNDLDANLRALAESVSAHSKTIVSHENISLPARYLKNAEHKPALYWKAMAGILEKNGIFNVTIVVYLRRQDDWIASSWKQMVKGGYHESLGELLNRPDIHSDADYAHLLSMAESAFHGSARIIVRPYSRDRFVGGSIQRDFCATCEIPWDEGYSFQNGEVNPSISFDVSEALRLFRLAARTNTPLRRKVLVPLAIELTKQNPDAPRTTPFDFESTSLLMAPYLAGNEHIAEKYLDGGPLFSDDYEGRPVWVPNSKRIAEYQAVFKEAIRSSDYSADWTDRPRSLSCLLPSDLKQNLKVIGNRVIRKQP